MYGINNTENVWCQLVRIEIKKIAYWMEICGLANNNTKFLLWNYANIRAYQVNNDVRMFMYKQFSYDPPH